MSWRGRFAFMFVLVSVALLGLTAFAGAKPLPPPARLGLLSPFKLADGLPKALGPSIIDAVYRATAPAGAANDSLYIIFSEDLTPATVIATDFNVNGGLATGDVGGLTGGVIARKTRNLVVMTGFTNAYASGDSIQLAMRGAVTGADGSLSQDMSLIPIRTGPAIYRAEIRNGTGGGDTDMLSDRPAGDTLRVYFTHEIVGATLNTADARVDFDMAEFGTGTANLTSALRSGAGFGNEVVDIMFNDQDAASAASHGKVLAGVSTVRVRSGALGGNFASQGDAGQDTNPASPWHIVDSATNNGVAGKIGPYIVSAGYNNKGTGSLADDVLTLVLSGDVDPSSVTIGDLAFGGTITTPPTSPVLSHNDGDNILQISDFNGEVGAVVGGTITIAGAITDFAGNANSPGDNVAIVASPIIVLARFQDGGDSDPATDLVEIYFDEPIMGATADSTDFDYYGFVSDGLLVTDNTDNDSLITLTGFTPGNTWERGDRIGLRAGATLMAGGPAGVPPLPQGNGLNASETGINASRLVRDYSAPRLIRFALNDTYFRDTQGAGNDTAFYAFDETAFDDAAYFLLFTRKDIDVDRTYIETYLNNGVFIADPNPGSLPVPPEATEMLNRNLIATYDITPAVGHYSDGQVIQLGENVHFGIIAVDADGNIALNTPSNLFSGALTAGPVVPPIDHNCVANAAVPGTTTDTDMIHVVGTRNPDVHAIFGDAGSAMNVDSVRVYDGSGLGANLLGTAVANANGSWGPITIGTLTGDFVWVRSVEVIGAVVNVSDPAAIRNDAILRDNIYAGTFRDPLNAFRRYSPGDTVRILGAASDTSGSPDPVVNPGMTFKSDLLALSADFRGFSTRAGSDSVLFLSLGANKNDEDNDWIDNGPVAFNGTALANNGIKDYPEPYVDENGNGQYDCGESFVDYTGANYTANIYDPGDANLDSNDPNEHGWYFVEYWIDPNNATLVADPDGSDNFAVLKDVNIPIRVEDNAVTSQAALDLLSANPDGSPRATMTFQNDLSLHHLANTAVSQAFTATLDSQAPTVSEISFLEVKNTLTTPTDYPAGNLMFPGDHAYKLPSGIATPYMSFVDSTLSDDDVIFVATQLDTTPNTSDDAGWRYLSLDPPGDRGTLTHDDGLPGIPLLDDDYDSLAAKTNGIDDDENGVFDNDGEGVDLGDAQVVDAMQADAAADAAAPGGDGIYRTNDGIDNDNDAFFRYNPFLGIYVWFNVDESTTNGVDDDGDGQVDEADEVENYNPAFDDDEDGMQDGSVIMYSLGGNLTATQLALGGGGGAVIGVKAFEDPAVLARFRGSRNTTAVASGPGATPGSWLTSYLDKTSDVIGNLAPGYPPSTGADEFAGVTFGARNILSANPGFPADLSPGTTSFDWNYVARTGRNIDLSHLQKLYDLADGSEYRMRAVAVDRTYNHNPNWSVPFRFTLDSVAPVVCIAPAQNSTTPGTGAAPEFDGFVDVRPDVPGLQVNDRGAHPGPYTLTAEPVGDGSDISEVHFQTWNGAAWVDMGVDTSAPFTMNWDAPLISNITPAAQDTFYFRAYAVDQFHNTEEQMLDNHAPTAGNGPAGATCDADNRTWELSVIVIDSTPPSSCVFQVGSDYNLADGAQVPVEQAVDVSAWFTDNDGIPGTNDVINVRFEYTPIGANDWHGFASLTGTITGDSLTDASGISHPLFPMGPDTLATTVTWDTRGLAAGSYEIRAVATDIEGNSSVLFACVFTVTLDNSALRAYVQPVEVSTTLDTCGVAGTASLYAQVFIHDRSVSRVEFQYYADTNGNGLADDGGTWATISTQGDDSFERKGDVTLRAGRMPFSQVPGGTRFQLNTAMYNGLPVRFWDADGDGYSSIDPMVADAGDDRVFTSGSDIVIGDSPGNAVPPNGAPLSDYPPNDYISIVDFTGTLEHNYIMQENPLNAGPEQIDVWKATWDLTGLNGSFLVRAVATDNLGNTDADSIGTGIPTAHFTIDSDIPSATVTQITLPNGTVLANLDTNPGQYISASNPWFFVTATPDSGVDDMKGVLFEWSRDLGATWHTLDVNDDNDYFADLNHNGQFDKGVDEIFIDTDASGTFTPGDIVLSKGDNHVLDTPQGFTLIPLVGEDPNDGIDNDGDGKVDEDASTVASALGGQSPADIVSPFTVPFLFMNETFATETNVLFRATAFDSAGNLDCTPGVVSVTVGDNVPPVTDIVVATVNGDSLDIETVLRGTVNPLCLDSTLTTPMHLLVTASDQAQITGIDIYYRVAPSSLPNFNPEAPDLTPWIAAGIVDAAYPYEFDWNISALPEGQYEFFARATDANGNVTPPPTNPYRFSIQRATATVASVVALGSGLPVSQAAAGDVVVLAANVDSTTALGKVCFYFAERVEGDTLMHVSTTYPYTAQISNAMIPPTGNGNDEIVTINGQPGVYIAPALFASTPGKTYLDYTMRSANTIEFGAALPAGATVTVSYNITGFTQIACDNTSPFTVEWTVPSPENSATTHFDVIATFTGAAGSCEEALLSEGTSIKVLDTEGARFLVHGIDDINNDGQIDLDDNRPGNALAVSRGLGFDNDSDVSADINKLSGDWAEVFVTTEETDVDSVWMVVQHTWHGDPQNVLPLTKNPAEADPAQLIHKVVYLSDFSTLDPTRVENVTITVSGYADMPSTRTFQMYDDGTNGDDLVNGDGHYTARLELPAGATYSYTYTIDLVGSDFITTPDPRNPLSQIWIPATPYWWGTTRLDNNSLFVENAVNHVHVNVRDHAGNVTTNLAKNNQGQIDVILDRTGPIVSAVTADRSTVGLNGEVNLFATVVDPNPPDVNIITTKSVEFQVSPDSARKVWLSLGTDTDPSNGWNLSTNFPFNPLDDNIDNNGNGVFDEAAESAFHYLVRAVATDDGYNKTYSSATGVVDTLTVDVTPPTCELTQPHNGDIFPHGSTITLASTSTDNDIAFTVFEYNIGNGWVIIDATPNDQTDLIGGLPGNMTPALPGQTVQWNTSFLTETDAYVRLRCVSRDIAGNYTGNFPGNDDVINEVGPAGEKIEYITILINDQTAPFAALQEVLGSGASFCTKSIVDPSLTLSNTIDLIGIASFGNQGDVATVLLQTSLNGTNWTNYGVTNALIPINATQKRFAITLNTRNVGLPPQGGNLWLRVAAMDADGNLQGDTNKNGLLDDSETVTGTLQVRVSNSEPDMQLVKVGPAGTGTSRVADNTIVQYDLWPAEAARGSLFACGDCTQRLANDLTFQAADIANSTPNAIDFVMLQFLDDVTDPEHPTWKPQMPAFEPLDADHNGIIDQTELNNWLANRGAACEAFQEFLNNNGQWRFSYRDSAGVHNIDGNWYLQFDGTCGFSGVKTLKQAMQEVAGALPDKAYRFRALAVDYAGNANVGDTGVLLRIDSTDPTVEKIFVGNSEFEGGGDGTGTVHVAGGDVVPVAALVTDDCSSQLSNAAFGPPAPNGTCQSSGIYGVQFQYRTLNGDGTWHIIGLGVFNPATGRWELPGGWTTPANLTVIGNAGSPTADSLFTIRAVAVDSAGNCGSNERENAVAVQDVTPPANTEIVDINGECTEPAVTTEETVRSPAGTRVSDTVTLVAATQFGDASMLPDNSDISDVFKPTVFFEVRRLDANGAPVGDWMQVCSSQNPMGGGAIEPGDLNRLTIGDEDNGLAHMGPIWQCLWDTKQLNGSGQRIWPDATYQLRAWGRDAFGNSEVLTGTHQMVLVTVDNTPPVVALDANPATPSTIDTRERTATAERNDCRGYTFTAITNPANEDLTVTFWYKLSTDLNVPESWKMVEPGVNGSTNPDTNRPYSFTWDLNSIADCNGSLVPGTSYDIVASAGDLICNQLTPVAAFAADLGIRLSIVDTIAPRAQITELVRSGGNTSPVKFPENVHVNSINTIQATILPSVTVVNGTAVDTCGSPRDVQRVQFWFTPRTNGTPPAFSTTTWTLADGDVGPVGANTWQLNNWSSDGLAEGPYWFAAVAQDCFGNTDTAPQAITIVVDRTCPTFVGVNPVNDQKLVAEVTSPNGPRNVDLIVRNTDNDVEYTTAANNMISFQYKPSEAADVPENWITITSQELRNGGTGSGANEQPTYSASIDLRNLVNLHNQCANQSGLYDFRVVASDAAGNECATVFAQRVVVDNTPPVVEISAIQFLNTAGADSTTDLTVQPVSGNKLPDISAGQRVRVFATAEDDEPCIPPSHETQIYEVQFYLVGGPNGSGTYPQNLGTAGFDQTTGQYFITWNTTGLNDGNYVIQAKAQDEARNFNTSQTVVANVTNPARPLAQVAAFNPDLLSEITKGTENRIYGITFGEKLANSMFFQYSLTQPGGCATDNGNWINIGAATNTGETLTTRELSLLPQSLWYSNFRLSDIPTNTPIWFRAVAVASSSLDSLGFGGNIAVEPAGSTESNYYGRLNTGRGFEPMDGTPGDFSGLYDLCNTPVLRMVKTVTATGQATLEQTGEDPAVEGLIQSVTTENVDFSSNGLITVKTGGPLVSPFVVLVAEDNRGRIDEAIPEMNRRVDDNTVWTGDILGSLGNFQGIDPTEGARIGVFASASLKRTSTTAPAPRTDLDWKIWHIWQVTPNAGSNGWAGVDGNGALVPLPLACTTDNIPGGPYPADAFAANVPPGAFNYNVGMLLDRVARPTTPATQDLYINVVGQSYSIRFMDSDWDAINWSAAGNGWLGRACIHYSDSLVTPNEGTVSVRRWDGSEWTVEGLSHIDVDPCANVVCFNFDPEFISTDNLIVSVVTGDQFSPVQTEVYPSSRGFTDKDPIFKTVLTNVHGGRVNQGDISIYIRQIAPDSSALRLVAQTRGSGSRWLRYAGSWMDVQQVDTEGNVWAVTFGWPCEDALGLAEGTYEFEVRFTDFARSEFFGVGEPFVFEVDRTPPTIIFNGGFVGDPILNARPAYVGTDSLLTVRIIDNGSGVLFREDRIDDDDYSHYWWNNVEDQCAIARFALLYDSWFYENGIPIQFDRDNSFKYDLWRADGTHDQNSAHEYEERTLLHTGTADELWPNVTHPVADSVTVNGVRYARQNVWDVPLFILGGGAIQNNDALSIVLYSNRYETPPINQLNEYLDQIAGLGGVGSEYGEGWWIDFSTKRVIQYAKSIQDQVHNVGSRFLEQRFVVDTEAPTVEVTSPGVNCDGAAGVVTSIEPTGDYTFTATIHETGSGIDPSTVNISVTGPMRSGVEDIIDRSTVQVTANSVTFVIRKENLLVGQYHITISGRDRLGNTFTKTCVLTVGGTNNALSNATAYPNPFNPRDTDVTLAFTNARQSNVRIAIYDWNGDKVRTIDAGSMTPGPQVVKWGGDAEDGTPLANGVYLARIEANDGRRTVTQVVKVAIWRD